jgi:hypothetical protein
MRHVAQSGLQALSDFGRVRQEIGWGAGAAAPVHGDTSVAPLPTPTMVARLGQGSASPRLIGFIRRGRDYFLSVVATTNTN